MPGLLKPIRLMMASWRLSRKRRGLGVAGLGAGRDGADLDEAESHAAEGVDAVAFLVEARGEADGIGKLEAHALDRMGGPGAGEAGEESELLGPAHALHGDVMGAFGVELEEAAAGEGINAVKHGTAGA